MSQIILNLSEIEKCNARLPIASDHIGNVKNSMAVLKWRISEDISDKGNIRPRIEKLCRELEEMKDMVDDLHLIIQDSVDKYRTNEQTISLNANKFD